MKINSLLIAALLGAATVAPAQEAKNMAHQCIVGAVKLSWRPVPRCIVFDNEAKFKATLDAWGWDPKQTPKVNWAKQMAVIDSANNPYGNGVANCQGLFTDTEKTSGTLRWAWQQQIPQSAAAARERAKAAESKQDPITSGKGVGEAVKESALEVASDARQGVKDIVEDFKKFPSPIPKRAAVVAIFSKELLGKNPKIGCVMDK